MSRAATARAAPKAPPRTIIQAIDDPHLFGGMFDDQSWRPWRVFLKALQALPMDADEFALYPGITQPAKACQRPRRAMPS